MSSIKHAVVFVLIILIIGSLSASSTISILQKKVAAQPIKKAFTDSDFDTLYSNPNSYVGSNVNITGKIFNFPPSGITGLRALQMLLMSSNHLAFAQIPGIINTPSSSPGSDQQQQSTNDNLGQEQNQVDSFAVGFLNACNSTNTIDESLSRFENMTSLAKHSHAYQQGYYNAINNLSYVFVALIKPIFGNSNYLLVILDLFYNY